MRMIVKILMAGTVLLGLYLPSEAKAASEKDISVTSGRESQSIPESKFREIFDDYLHRQLGKNRSDIVLSSLKVLGNKPLPKGAVSFQVFQNDKRRLLGQVRVIAVVSVDGIVQNKVRLSGWVDVFEGVVCATRNLSKGEIIGQDDLYLKRQNISKRSSNILTDMHMALGFMAKHNIRKDSSLKEWMVERPPVVDKGDVVKILAESGGLRVTVPGTILEKGYMGESVRVQNTMSLKKIYARVIDSHTVRVDF
jgi:flagella basal body P-ring formation protein FlgA